jgi:hypothetical protein
LGGLWVLPKSGGDAHAIPGEHRSARRPRWSPDGEAIVFESNSGARPTLWIYSFASNASRPLGDAGAADSEPDWHPDGRRVVFSSTRDSTNFNIWEMDVATGLSWRLTDLPGHESEPAWSANGEDLLFVHEHSGSWSLMLRRRGKTDEVLVTGSQAIAAPSWRPDGSLVTYLVNDERGWRVQMTILSQPRLTRELVRDEDFFLAPISWIDRQQMVYAAGGQLRLRRFNSWSSTSLPFRANVGTGRGRAGQVTVARELPSIEPPDGRRVIRGARLFDGVGSTYDENADVLIEGGVIRSVEARRDHGSDIVIDLGDATILPGYIDAYTDLPQAVPEQLGPLLLSMGVTTLVTGHPRAQELDAAWSGKELPGPRVLPAASIELARPHKPYPWLVTISGDIQSSARHREAVSEWQEKGVAVLADNWQAALGSGATLMLGTRTRPTSPQGIRYQDVQLAGGTGSLTFVSGLASWSTPGVADIWISRQARLLAPAPTASGRFSETGDLSAAAPLLVLGSNSNGLPPGIALHAEIRALAAAGLRNEQVLRATGVNAAAALGFGLKLGRVAVGAAADLVIVAGDPLVNITDTLKIIAVVRNGRFYSVSGLIDIAEAAEAVE